MKSYFLSATMNQFIMQLTIRQALRAMSPSHVPLGTLPIRGIVTLHRRKHSNNQQTNSRFLLNKHTPRINLHSQTIPHKQGLITSKLTRTQTTPDFKEQAHSRFLTNKQAMKANSRTQTTPDSSQTSTHYEQAATQTNHP